MGKIGAALAVALVLLSSACGGRSAAPVPLIVDTDLSTDDIVALGYVLHDPKVRVAAVTVSGTGLVECPVGAANASALVSAFGHPEIPVACGRELPLVGTASVPAEWRQAANGMFGLVLPRGRAPARADAARLLADTIRSAGARTTVLELAPMTNLAEAFRADPGLAGMVNRVVAMGGAVAVPGNTPDETAAEVNVYADPVAARTVLRSGAPVTLVPLDATNQVPVTPFFGKALQRYHHQAPAATIVWDLVSRNGLDHGGTYFWDPLAAVAVTHPALVPTQGRRIEVSRVGATTVAAGGAAVRVATGTNRARFERELLSTLLDGKPFVLPPHTGVGTVVFGTSGCGYRGATQVVTGEVVLDSVNRTATPFQWIAGRLDGRHTLAELKRYAADPASATKPPPKWFEVDAAGTTPPHSTMTWSVYLPTGTTGQTILACATTSPPSASVATVLSVFGRG